MPKATKKAPEIEILEALLALRTTIDRKCKRLKLTSTWSDRGIPCVRSTASGAHAYLEIFEGGYRGSLWPRVVYVLDGRHFGNGIANTVRAARKAELAEPNKMVARRDLRGCAVVEPDVILVLPRKTSDDVCPNSAPSGSISISPKLPFCGMPYTWSCTAAGCRSAGSCVRQFPLPPCTT